MSILGNVSNIETIRDTYKQYHLDSENIPEHIAVIMDGNGRWAKKRLLPRTLGHNEGKEALRRTIKACVELGVHYLSVYVFSTENWIRPEKEVTFLMKLLEELSLREIPELNKQGVCVKVFGDLNQVNQSIQNNLKKAEELTQDNSILQLNLMINYGARNEIVNACKTIINEGVSSDSLDEKVFSHYLYTAGTPDPDILVRTSGEIRISNFLLWQLAYSELIFLDVLWPDFGKEALISVIKEYQTRQRRFGDTGE